MKVFQIVSGVVCNECASGLKTHIMYRGLNLLIDGLQVKADVIGRKKVFVVKECNGSVEAVFDVCRDIGTGTHTCDD